MMQITDLTERIGKRVRESVLSMGLAGLLAFNGCIYRGERTIHMLFRPILVTSYFYFCNDVKDRNRDGEIDQNEVEGKKDNFRKNENFKALSYWLCNTGREVTFRVYSEDSDEYITYERRVIPNDSFYMISEIDLTEIDKKLGGKNFKVSWCIDGWEYFSRRFCIED